MVISLFLIFVRLLLFLFKNLIILVCILMIDFFVIFWKFMLRISCVFFMGGFIKLIMFKKLLDFISNEKRDMKDFVFFLKFFKVFCYFFEMLDFWFLNCFFFCFRFFKYLWC